MMLTKKEDKSAAIKDTFLHNSPLGDIFYAMTKSTTGSVHRVTK